MLEERVREFVEKARDAAVQGVGTEPTHDGEEEEGWEVIEHGHGVASEDGHEVDEVDKELIVFTPKKHKASTTATSTTSTTPPPSTIPNALPIYHSPPTDPSAPFIRWLVHSIAEYYGLHSWSVTEQAPPIVESAIPSFRGNGNGEVRVAYVGLEPQKGEVLGKSKGKGKKAKRRGCDDDDGGCCVEGRRKVDMVVGRRKLPVKMPRPLWVIL